MIIGMKNLTEDAKAILLLCCRFGKEKGIDPKKPLSLSEYNRLTDWMVDHELRPADLINTSLDLSTLDAYPEVDRHRVQALLARGAAMALAVEKWSHSGIWVVCRSDEHYPVRFKKHLKRQAPPVLFGVGDIDLLNLGGLAIVGSRNVDVQGGTFTRVVAKACAGNDMMVISGDTRGVDQAAMIAALEAGGKVACVLSNSLQKASLAGKFRAAIRGKRLALVSPFHPDARFNVGNTMERNKYIYALADFALIVTAEVEKGVTWAGAMDELKREGGRPVFVRTGKVPPPGNRELLNLGAQPFPDFPWQEDLNHLLSTAESTNRRVRAFLQQSLFVTNDVNPVTAVMVKDKPSVFERNTDETPVVQPVTSFDGNVKAMPTIYDAVKPVLLIAMDDWVTPAYLVKKLEVRKAQLDDWLKRAIDEGIIEKKRRPLCYRKTRKYK